MKSNWRQLKKQLLKDKVVKKAYKELSLEFKIIDQIIVLRKQLSITQSQLAQKVKTTQSAIARFESGKNSPTVDFLRRLAKALHCDLEIQFKLRA